MRDRKMMISNKDEFNDKLCDLMEEVENCNPPEFSMDGMIFSDKAKEYIYELADYARSLELYRRMKEGKTGIVRKEYEEAGMSASRIYIDMMHKIVNAPTVIHMELVPVMLIPLIDERLRGGNNDK